MLSDDCFCRQPFPFACMIYWIYFFCTYKDDDDGEVTMDSTVDNTNQGTYVA